MASAAAAFAQDADQLIACRALMGVGGATLMPSVAWWTLRGVAPHGAEEPAEPRELALA